MLHMTQRSAVIFLALLLTTGMAVAQAQHQGLALTIQGCPGDAPTIQLQGRTVVDVQELARATNGTLSFDKDHVILTLPRCDTSKPVADESAKPGFSHAFTRAAIEAMASIREWGGMLMITVENGYPVGNTMAGNTILAYEGRAADNVALASSAASTDSDRRGLELLKNEFNNVQAWSDAYIKARNSLHAANYSISETQFSKDEEVQKLVHCGQFLGQMFASGTFQDDGSCR